MGVQTGLGDSLRKFRESRKWTQMELAKRLGLNRTTYANYESEIANPPKRVMDELARLGYDPDKNPNQISVDTPPDQLMMMLEALYHAQTPEQVRDRAYKSLRRILGLENFEDFS
jgi:transcriptional regulator with XRE-family HTH domain